MSSNYNRQDHLYRKAKNEGYRSRAAYKLLELDGKHAFLKLGSKILDLGSWPGGWLQVACAKTGPNGVVVGIDIEAIEPLPYSCLNFIHGDASDPAQLDQALKLAGTRFDTLLSDISPKLSGIKEVDAEATVAAAELALGAARRALKSGGVFVIKVFKNQESEKFVKNLRSLFNKLIRAELDATRSTSNEYYLVGFGFKVEDK